jgi:predicted TIM-barrel enzyme
MSEQSRWVYPVVHHLNASLSIGQAKLAFACGADGVFFISHGGQNKELFIPACAVKHQYPDKSVGLNLLGEGALYALEEVVSLKLDMVWTDKPGVSSAGWTEEGSAVVQKLKGMKALGQDAPAFFGSVAFKYQPHEPEPEMAAVYANSAGMIATTSGSGTGSAPEVGKVQRMHDAICNGKEVGRGFLAVASGMTPENVQDYLPHVTHHLVATGVSTDMHHFDPERLKRFIELVHAHR